MSKIESKIESYIETVIESIPIVHKYDEFMPSRLLFKVSKRYIQI